jgi:hypothetical protein
MLVVRCDCGTEKPVQASSIAKGYTTSCGCFGRERRAASRTKHGYNGTPEYLTWQRIKNRCLNPNAHNYSYYGGRGVQVDAEWAANFPAFLRDVGPKPSKRHTIERVDVNGHYAPGNVKWATWKEQQNNRRNTGKNRRP